MTPSDEMQLRSRIATLEAMVEQLYRHFGLAFQPPTVGAPPGVIEALRAGNMIDAIKRYRDATGADLASAKAAVEALRAQLL